MEQVLRYTFLLCMVCCMTFVLVSVWELADVIRSGVTCFVLGLGAFIGWATTLTVRIARRFEIIT